MSCSDSMVIVARDFGWGRLTCLIEYGEPGRTPVHWYFQRSVARHMDDRIISLPPSVVGLVPPSKTNIFACLAKCKENEEGWGGGWREEGGNDNANA